MCVRPVRPVFVREKKREREMRILVREKITEGVK